MSPELAAEALFASSLQRSDHPSPVQVDAAIEAALLLHGTEGCAAVLAQAYGDDQTLARARMGWCLSLIPMQTRV